MDNRKWESGASATPPAAPGSPSTGYPTEGDPLAVIPPTNPGAFWFHAIGEEIRAVIVDAGLTPALGTLTQLRDAIAVIMDAGLTPVLGTLTQLRDAIAAFGNSAFWGYASPDPLAAPGNIDYLVQTAPPLGIIGFAFGVLHIASSGIYLVSASAAVGYDGGGSGAKGAVSIRHNEIPIAVAYWQEQNNTTEWGTVSICIPIQLLAGDSVAVFFDNLNSSASVKANYGSFSGVKIR